MNRNITTAESQPMYAYDYEPPQGDLGLYFTGESRRRQLPAVPRCYCEQDRNTDQLRRKDGPVGPDPRHARPSQLENRKHSSGEK